MILSRVHDELPFPEEISPDKTKPSKLYRESESSSPSKYRVATRKIARMSMDSLPHRMQPATTLVTTAALAIHPARRFNQSESKEEASTTLI